MCEGKIAEPWDGKPLEEVPDDELPEGVTRIPLGIERIEGIPEAEAEPVPFGGHVKLEHVGGHAKFAGVIVEKTAAQLQVENGVLQGQVRQKDKQITRLTDQLARATGMIPNIYD